MNPLNDAKLIADEITSFRRELHKIPEIGLNLPKTRDFVTAKLDEWGVKYQTFENHSAVVAVIGNCTDKVLAIRADMDALPIKEEIESDYMSTNENMHACGHDAHAAILLGVAKILKANEDQLKGTVKLFFQPGEEGPGGAAPMIADGCLLDPPVKRVMGLHVDPEAPVGKVTFFPKVRSASSTAVTIIVHGKSCHGAQPQTGVDAVLAGAHVVTALQNLVSRTVSPTDPVVLTIGQFNAGTKGNIVAGTAEMHGTLRAMSLETRDLMKERIRKVAESTAALYGATVEVTIQDSNLPVIPHGPSNRRMLAVAREALGEENVIVAKEPVMTAEDFCYFLNEVPGTFFDLGTTAPDCQWPQTLHNDRFTPDESCIKTGILLEVLGALAFLTDGE